MGSGHTGTPISDDIPTARPSHPLSQPRIKQLCATSGEGDPPPAAALVIAPKPVVIPSAPAPVITPATPAAPAAPRHTRATAAATPAAAPVAAAAPVPGRSSLKRSATPPHPETWATCVRCRSQKKGCMAARDANPPYSACTLCLKSGQPCIRWAKSAGGEYDLFLSLVLIKDRILSAAKRTCHHQASPSPHATATLAVPLAPLCLPADGRYSDMPPEVLLRGSTNASLSDLLGWHHKIQTTHRERAAATTRLEAAECRYRTMWDGYITLYACAMTDREAIQEACDKGKGKGHASPPLPGGSKGRTSPDDGDIKDEMTCEETSDTAQGGRADDDERDDKMGLL